MIIGIIGKIGTGKSHVAKYLKRKLKCQHLDADKIRLQIAQRPENIDLLTKTFGRRIQKKNKRLDRNKLMLAVCQDTVRLGVFSDYFDKQVGEMLKTLSAALEDKDLIIESSNPIEQDIQSLFDITIHVITPKRVAYKRLLKRYPKYLINNLWNWQRLGRNATFILENKSSIHDLKFDVGRLFEEITKQKIQYQKQQHGE